MTVKHQPATPLPWHQGPIDGGENANNECVFDKDGEIVADCGARATLDAMDWPECEKNAAYIAHAAVAYPKLVEVLRELSLRNPFPVQALVDGEALLRELGEVS